MVTEFSKHLSHKASLLLLLVLVTNIVLSFLFVLATRKMFSARIGSLALPPHLSESCVWIVALGLKLQAIADKYRAKEHTLAPGSELSWLHWDLFFDEFSQEFTTGINALVKLPAEASLVRGGPAEAQVTQQSLKFVQRLNQLAVSCSEDVYRLPAPSTHRQERIHHFCEQFSLEFAQLKAHPIFNSF